MRPATPLLDPLPPDLEFEPLPPTEAAFLFSFAVKKDALGEHVAARWGWDDDFQRGVHRQRFEARPFLAILRNGEAVGTLSFVVEDDHIRLGEFYLLGQHRNTGLGTRILVHALDQADAIGRPVRLEYLKWNPVGSLYRRHGFVDTHMTETHFHLERPVPMT
ncbi:MAG TPA: GNAT family N-acetyltransferase [Devosiaceae bacterium]|jgi:GNAT superfamily N-acetyltransferase